MGEGKHEGYMKILNSYKQTGKKVMIITIEEFFYTAEIIEVYDDSVLFSDKYQNEILLTFSQIKQIGGFLKHES